MFSPTVGPVTAIAREYTDPRLVAVYDALNPVAADTAFYLRLAEEVSATSIVDLGCGTGLLTCELARRGHQVTGVDPSPQMLDVARRRLCGSSVRWVLGGPNALAEGRADLALMTGHVAQVFLDEDAWRSALASIHAALRPGGRVAFESRNPRPRPWAGWTPEASRRVIESPQGGLIEVWHRLLSVRDGRVRFENHYRFVHSGDVLVSTAELRFRTQAELVGSLADAGFDVEHVYGDWDRRPVEEGSRELIFVATRA